MIDTLIHSCSNMKRVSSAAAEAYAKESEQIVNLVSLQIVSDPRIPLLVGNTPPSFLQDRLAGRAGFMRNVFRLNSCELLVRAVAWEYRVQNARGFSFDYFPIEFSAWKGAVPQRLEPSCAEEVIAVYDWLIRNHQAMVLLSLADEGLTSPMPVISEVQDSLLTLLLQGNSKQCLELVSREVHDLAQLKSFYLDQLYPVLCRLGLLWEKNEISVAEEHLATAIVGRITAALYVRIARSEYSRGKAVVTAGPGELHEVGARMVADFLEMEGWEVIYLGGNISAEEIIFTLQRLNPFLVAMSVTTVFHLDAAWRLIHRIKSEPGTEKIRVLLGGFAFNCVPRLSIDFEADGYEMDAAGAASTANAWWEHRKP